MKTTIALGFCILLLCRGALRELVRPKPSAAAVTDVDLREHYPTR